MHKNAPQKQRRQLSLRSVILLLIFVCWVLPLLLTVGISGYTATQKTHEHVADIVNASVQSSMDIVRRDLNGIVSTSLNASYIATIRNAYSQYLLDTNVSTFYTQVNSFLTDEYSRNQMICSTYILFPHITGNVNFVWNSAVTDFQSTQAALQNGAINSALDMFSTLGSNIAFIQAQERLYLVRTLTLVQNRFEPYAILLMEINLPLLCDSLQNLPWLTDATIILNGGQAVLTPFGSEVTGPAQPITPQQENIHLYRQGATMLLHGAANSNRFTLEYHVRANAQPLLGEVGNPLPVILLSALLIIPMMAAVVVVFYSKITRPISRLQNFAANIEEGQFGTQIDTGSLGSPDFGTLGRQMNAMSARLQNQFQRIYREELALRDARIKALQSQINPHFMGNTLETINWEARLAGNVKVSAMLEALSTMLEAALDRRHRPLVHLSEEMMYVNAYLFIIKERLGRRLAVQQEIDPALLDWPVPRLILQPIVENAVEHGINARQRGTITIRAVQLDDEWMELQVENDAPLTAQDTARVGRLLGDEGDEAGESSANIGIRNVHQRLRILYGPKSGLSIKNNKKGHTVSSMCIQVQQKPQENTT